MWLPCWRFFFFSFVFFVLFSFLFWEGDDLMISFFVFCLGF